MKFAITGLGRSGTLSLSSWLQRNINGVSVQHEPDMVLVRHPNDVAQRFVENYGEVNSYLRFVLMGLPVDKKAVLIRNPESILRSAMVRKGHGDFDHLVREIARGLKSVDDCAVRGARVIRFERMVTEEDYRQELYHWLGLDVPEGFEHLNNRLRPYAGNLDRVPAFDWFVERYYGEC